MTKPITNPARLTEDCVICNNPHPPFALAAVHIGGDVKRICVECEAKLEAERVKAAGARQLGMFDS
jgi:hypothetical protein